LALRPLPTSMVVEAKKVCSSTEACAPFISVIEPEPAQAEGKASAL
jgi:hypothetical protein